MAGDLRVVGIGASAGGVEALTDFFAHVPPNTGMAYLVVLHLLPGYVSRLPEIIARVASMPVEQAADGRAIEADHVYVIPPDSLLSVSDGQLCVQAPSLPGHGTMPIDFLFSSMAADVGSRAIGVVLSGVGSDGALGLKAIKQADGFAVAQGSNGSRPRHAEMPAAAIAATAVDLVLPVEQMGERIAHLPLVSREPPAADGVDDETSVPAADREQIADVMPVICTLLRSHIGHDFSGYKRATFMRRVHRRMQFFGIDANGYVDRLRTDQQEVALLFHDLLIGVTSFFRDPEVFDALRQTIIPQLFAGKSKDGMVRVWVPGCSTGEEAYSLAMLMREHMTTLPDAPRVQVFATDLDEVAISLARIGRYPAALVKPVPSEYLARFFTVGDGGYAVTKDIRELCTFSVHSLVRDPPFSRLDLISCRNVLIYLDADLQASVARTFHYALAPGGVLVLGTSETVTRYAELFQLLDRKHRIFQRMEGVVAPLPVAELALMERAAPLPPGRTRTAAAIASEAANLANARVLDHFAPAFVVVNTTGEVLHFSSRTGKYLEAAAGAPSRDVVSMARRGLRPELRAALRSAIETGRPILRERVQVDVDGGVQEISLTAEPLGPRGPESHFLVVFSDISQMQPRDDAAVPLSPDVTVDQLERDLGEMREQLQSTSEEHETALEELKSSNEELHSVNEELQSTNEELETSREEIQSMNEELQTVNAQLTSKIEELDRVNSDLRNLFESTKVATIFLDRFMVIRSFTPAVSGVYNLIPGDIGRPLTDITSQLHYMALQEDFRRVMQTLQPLEQRVINRDGSTHYLMRIAPYRTADNKVDGALLTFVDVSTVVHAGESGRLLAGVLSERVRVIVALAVELADRTMREVPVPQAFASLYQQRVGALIAACELMEHETWAERRLREVVLRELQPHLKPVQGGVSLEGPIVILRSRGVLGIGLIVHDLARQSAAAGALMATDGRVSIRWQIEESADGPNLTWNWIETGVSAGAAPFDLSLVELCAEHELRATVGLQMDAVSRRVTLTTKLDAIGTRSGGTVQ